MARAAREDLLINIILKSEKAKQDLNKLNKSFAKLERVSRLNKVMDGLNLKLDKANRLVSKTSDKSVPGAVLAMGELQAKLKGLQRVFLGVGLATLFFGMSVKNAAQNAIKGFVKTWATVMEGSTMYNETLGRLNASFQFLKFAIADAFLSSELGQFLIDKLIKIMDWVSALDPKWQKWIFLGLIIAFVLGTILMIFGQISLAILGPLTLLEKFPVIGLLASNIFRNMSIPILFILIIIGLIIALVKIWKSDLSLIIKIILTIAAVMIALVLLASLFGVALTPPLLILFALVGLAVALGIALATSADTFKLKFLNAVATILRALAKLPFVGHLARGALGIVEGMIGKIEARQADQAEGAPEEKSFFDKAKEQVGEFTKINVEGDIVMPEGTDMENFGTGIKEESLHNAGAGTG